MSTPRKPAQTQKAETTDKAQETAKVAETAVTKSTDLAGEGGEKENAGKTQEADLQVTGDTKVGDKTIDEIVAEKVAEALKDKGDSNPSIESKVPETKTDKAEVAQIADKEVKKVKIKFIKDHSFYINTEKNDAKPGDVLMVERHIANKLVGRHIAYILG